METLILYFLYGTQIINFILPGKKYKKQMLIALSDTQLLQ